MIIIININIFSKMELNNFDYCISKLLTSGLNKKPSHLTIQPKTHFLMISYSHVHQDLFLKYNKRRPL